MPDGGRDRRWVIVSARRDLYGLHPTSEGGGVFGSNVAWWPPLWDYCHLVAPKLARKLRSDGSGLTGPDTRALATALQAEIDSGRCAAYAQARAVRLAGVSDEPCAICESTGGRQAPPAVGAGPVPCNGCAATGHARPWWTKAPFAVEYVQTFVPFLRDCGGFRIDLD